ncbi:MAG: tetratricopeptide repeat protein [Vicingaceae bacterium]
MYNRSSAQSTLIYTAQPNKTYNTALELFDKEKYGAAQEAFVATYNLCENKLSEMAVNAKYYEALCCLNLFNNNAEGLLIEFVNNYPESPKTKWAYFDLGNYFFRKKKYKEALAWYDKLDVYDLNSEKWAEYYFKTGYAYFELNEESKASQAFYEIKDVDNSYASAAKYYYGHIAYNQKKYQSALQSFKMLANDENFGSIVPYYIVQIYYKQQKFDSIIAYAPSVLENAIPKRAPEIALLLGDAYYKTKQFDKAIPYLLQYEKQPGMPGKDVVRYQIGYSFYKTDSCNNSVEWFGKVADKKDSIAQLANYHMAECYLKLNQKQYAKSSFRLAADLDFNKNIKEDALFAFAKISYELSIHPFNDAIIAFEEFINTYPSSKKIKDAYEYLVAVYFTTKNYAAAVASIEKIKTPGFDLQKAYQKLTYYRALELFNNSMYQEALKYFEKAYKYQHSKEILALTKYWEAETYFRLSNYAQSINGFKQFLLQPEAINTDVYQKANYNIGYGYFKLKEYENALPYFRNYVNNDKADEIIKNDALNRVADCFFITKNYKAAVEYYDKALLAGKINTDYAAFQSAVANGVLGNYDEKINLLNTLLVSNAKDKKTHLYDDALFEIGKAYLIKNQNKKALEYFNQLTTEFKNSPYVKEAYLKKGLIYFNAKEDDEALTAFKKVVEDYPNTSEAKEALEKIKRIYVEQGNIEKFEQYLAGINYNDEEFNNLDEDYYEIAENEYMKGNCDKAAKDFSKYLTKYPNGNYVLNAHFYLAECELKSGFKEEALINYEYILNKPKNKFTEKALLKSAIISKELNKIQEAIDLFSKLEYLADLPENINTAQLAQMQLNYEINNLEAASKYAAIVIDKDVFDAKSKTQAHLILAHNYLAIDDYNKALDQFKIASSSQNIYGVEAKYYVAHIKYLRGKHDECETEIFSLIKNFGSYQYWIAKSLILLADNYLAKDDKFQAKATLQNVIDNAKDEELVSIAKDKLASIIKSEEESQRKVEEDIEVDWNIDETIYNKLFEEEIIEEQIPADTLNNE